MKGGGRRHVQGGSGGEKITVIASNVVPKQTCVAGGVIAMLSCVGVMGNARNVGGCGGSRQKGGGAGIEGGRRQRLQYSAGGTRPGLGDEPVFVTKKCLR